MITNTPMTAQIDVAVHNIPGWSPLDQLLTLFTLAYTSADLSGDILELGSWCGRSAVVLGMAAKMSGQGKVYCVDLFPEQEDWYKNKDGTYSFSVKINGKNYGAYGEQTVWAEPFLRDIVPVYERFEGTLEAFNYFIRENDLKDYVVPYRSDMEMFAKKMPETLALRLAFIDGDHSYKAVTKDIKIVEQFLLSGGWVCFDDAFSAYDGVNEAIQKHIIDSGEYRKYQQITRKFFIAQRR